MARGEVDMGRRMVVAVCSCILVFSAAAAHAEHFLTGNDLYRVCQGSGVDGGVCTGYVIGVFDQWAAGRAAGPFAKPACLPPGVGSGQLKDVVVRYLRDHPEVRDQSAWALVVHAMIEAWNCK